MEPPDRFNAKRPSILLALLHFAHEATGQNLFKSAYSFNKPPEVHFEIRRMISFAMTVNYNCDYSTISARSMTMFFVTFKPLNSENIRSDNMARKN